MASKQVAKAASNVIPVSKKATVQSTGLWDAFRRFVALDPERSSGVPLNPWYRNPAPGTNDPSSITDPVTAPAGDIADNPYWKRDNRRSYPKTSVFAQADVANLLTVGSAAQPKVELVGEAGEKALVEAREQGELGVAKVFRQNKAVAKDVFVDGLPPLPSGQSLNADGKWDVHKYRLSETSYGEGYPNRQFA
ncbi:hypothetical protein NLU13_5673 [Sarocladium strictum]|uniref:NADH-ubiquinone oxidoreductase 21.3 kDa subunit n=1 Tax=Sarocladium strictum TaxID=5046 RepID=A0AA39GHC1_SARSR|nr:hypothetical protein NLU13_5673 [Sarocladium strictum]